ncbi:putative glutamine amidotransferase [Mycobacterium frederiksbergense]|uniref:Glutamine amidotransferase n=1 Tax=Mycolicibacterium frederiksbergense TaxID=117567 RepID=A0ABT6L256_9MYCO|nr:gamma-glutamyl-gamma-aminobutyrate hydrolase family protein [Mycolicibacterium frederiksbergense]MDH6197021.1 putative glutamine amidotransferase [Mycolicibacterium frederiksbergense]
MSNPVILRTEVEPSDMRTREPGRPHIAVLVSLNFPGLTAPVAALQRRFTRTALAALAELDASFELVDTSEPGSVDVVVDADGLLVLGGGDIAAVCYGGPDGPVPNAYGVDEQADRVSLRMIQAYIDADRPVLGICRGSQLINVCYGGTIIADITDYQLHRGQPGEHLFIDEKVEVAAGTRLAAILGAGPIVVRSGHHQAVDAVADELVVAARALDGIVEGVEHPTDWVLGVQFHPEDDDGPLAPLYKLFAGFLAASGQPSAPTDQPGLGAQ